MDEIVKDFLIESNENLDRLDQELVRLESDPSSKELLASIFRTIHTIKGSCGFLGFTHLEKVAHVGENLLSRLRDGEIALTAEITSGLLAMVDAVRYMLNEIQTTEHDGNNDYPELLERLKGLQGEKAGKTDASKSDASQSAGGTNNENKSVESTIDESKAEAEKPAPPVVSAQSSPAAPTPETESTIAKTEVAKAEIAKTGRESERAADGTESHPARQSAKFLPAIGTIGGLLVERGQARPEDIVRALEEQERGDPRRVGEILVALGLCKAEDVHDAQQAIEARGREAVTETVRVGVSLLDRLMNLVGELVLARNQLLQLSNTTQDAGFQTISQRMNLIATELQEEVMKTRMQPIGNIWAKFPRTVRDVALGCGKEVHIEMEGKETELDKTIIEAIKDPLTHLVRNSVDHGIESPEVRVQAGKNAAGCLRLRAFHEGGQVNIEISDDGAGLNVERIRKKAIERGLVGAEQAVRMADREIFNLIFLPGFSTAEKITNVSGRGVGMDVVKTNVEKIGGTVDVQSALGKGTTVRVKIPLTLAIIPALVVTCRGERFAIPQVSLLELVRLDLENSDKEIEMVHGAPVYRLRGRLLPLVYLGRELRLPAQARGHGAPSAANIVVLQAEGRQFGLVVDEIIDTEEIVVKPLGKQLKGLSMYSGATIMGDGRVALILDILGVAQRAKVIAEVREAGLSEKDKGKHDDAADARQTLLLVRNGETGRMAIPLSLVARLEEFPRTAVERAGPQEVMQYRGQIMPLIRLSQVIPGNGDGNAPETEDDLIQVVVYSSSGRSVGLVVDHIVDIVEEKLIVQNPAQRRGVLGSSVIQQHVTDLVDVAGVVQDAIPSFANLALEAQA